MRAFGMPGVGGSLGKCCYCGDTFMKEILTGTNCQSINVGGQEMFVHIPDCLGAIVALATNGELQFSDYEKFPEESPLRQAMKKAIEEATHD
jgi:hypothetical protein